MTNTAPHNPPQHADAGTVVPIHRGGYSIAEVRPDPGGPGRNRVRLGACRPHPRS